MKAFDCITRNVRLIKENLSERNGYAIGIVGTPARIQAQLVSFINYGLCKSAKRKRHPFDGLHLGNPLHFQYVTCTKVELMAYLRYLVSLQFDIERIETPSLIDYIDRQAERFFDSISEQNFLNITDPERYDERDETFADAKREIAELKSNPNLLPVEQWA